MWPGPYGQGGGSRKYVLASLDQSLARMGLEYVDIFYSHRFDPETPIEETMMALDQAVRQGKALYAGISSYSAAKTNEAASIARELGTPLLIHQPSYSMLNRWIEEDLLDELEQQGMGCIVFTPLAQGLLTDRYLDGVPADSRAAREGSTIPGASFDEKTLNHVRRLNEIAEGRGQKLAQMALQWALRDPRVTSAVIGASSVEQLDTNLDAIAGPAFTDEELKAIDDDAVEAGVNLWAKATEDWPSRRPPGRRYGRPDAFPHGAADQHQHRQQPAGEHVDDVVLGVVDQRDAHRHGVEHQQPAPRASAAGGCAYIATRNAMPGVQRRHRGHLVADTAEQEVEPVDADVLPAAAGDPGQVGVDVALARGPPRRRHRVGDVDRQRAVADRDQPAHPQRELVAVADPQHRRDGQAGDEVGGVDGGEEQVVPARVAGRVAGAAAPGLLQHLRREVRRRTSSGRRRSAS